MSFKVFRYWSPASSPAPPKMSAIAAPTAAEFSGSTPSLADISRITSNIVLLPLTSSSCTCFESKPIFSNAVDVAVVISRNRIVASLIASIPLSENRPSLFVWLTMAINSSAFNPASLKNVEYSRTFCKNSPDTSAPEIRPSFSKETASSVDMPNCLVKALAVFSVSRKSFPNVSDMACTSFLNCFSSFPDKPVNCFVNRVASTSPAL